MAVDKADEGNSKLWVLTENPEASTRQMKAFYIYKYPHDAANQLLTLGSVPGATLLDKKRYLAEKAVFHKAIVPCVRSREPLKVEIMYKVLCKLES